MSLDVKEPSIPEAEKCPSPVENGSHPNKTMAGNASVDLTTAMGSTIDQDMEHPLLGESKESEEDLKEVLTGKIAELEKKLKQTDEYYEKLTKEVTAAKELYEKEREECEDVVSVAKRNIENQVSKILDLQKKKRDLAEKIRSEEKRLMKEEEKTTAELKSEEERLTKNIVVLQTKLLINEGTKFERDQLLSKIRHLENDLVEKEKYYQEELQKAKDDINEKYDRLLEIANNHKDSISDQVRSLSQRQQIAALKHAQEEIVKTQYAYKKTTKKLLREMDRNKILQERNHDMEVEVAVQQSLIAAAKARAQDLAEKKKIDAVEKISDKVEDSEEIAENLEISLMKKIEQLKDQLFRYMDEEAELTEILEDQRSYLDAVKNQRQNLHKIEQRLIPLADVAEYIVQKGRVEMKQNFDDPAARYDMFQKLAAILTESDKLQKYLCSDVSSEEQNKREKDDADILPPLKEETLRNTQRKIHHTPHMDYSCFTRRLDKVEKKILSDIGLLGKYGAKQKKYVSF